jgi:hypothetical protein
MTTNPINDLLDDYGVRRERAVKSTAGPYQDDRKAVVGAADAMIERVHRARDTLLAIDADLQRGVISQDQAPRLRQAVLDDARSYLDKSASATTKVLGVLPDRLLGSAFPLHHDRTTETAEAKADLDRELAGMTATQLPDALVASVKRRYSEGDTLAADLLLSGHGRDRLRSVGVADADAVHADIRRVIAPQVTPPTDERRQAVTALAASKDWAEAYMVGMNAADMMLSNLEAGRVDPDA